MRFFIFLFIYFYKCEQPLTVATCSELAKDAEYNRMKETTLNLITAGPAPKGYILSTSWLNRTLFSAGGLVPSVCFRESANSVSLCCAFALQCLVFLVWCACVWTTEWKKKSEPEDLSKNMNEKITCEHGNLCPAGGRRVVPAQV